MYVLVDSVFLERTRETGMLISRYDRNTQLNPSLAHGSSSKRMPFVTRFLKYNLNLKFRGYYSRNAVYVLSIVPVTFNGSFRNYSWPVRIYE